MIRCCRLSVMCLLVFFVGGCIQEGKENVSPSNSGGNPGNGSGGSGTGNGSSFYPYSNIPGNNIFYTKEGRLFIPNVFYKELVSEMGRCDTTSGFYVVSGIFSEDTLASFSVYFKTRPTVSRKFRITPFRDTLLTDTTVYLLVTDGTITRKTWRGYRGNMQVEILQNRPVVSFLNIKCENVANFSDTVWASGRVGCR